MEQSQEPNKNAWMVTFSDLVMLLLTFFVLLLSMSSMDSKKLKSLFTHFTESAGLLEFSGVRKFSDLATFIEKYNTSDSLLVIDDKSLREMMIPSEKQDKQTEEVFKDIEKVLQVADDERGIVFSINEKIVFDPGQEAIREEVYPYLDSIAKGIESCENDILIMGHTDSRPIKNGVFESNWELSAARGISVLYYFVEKKGLPQTRFSVGGYGETRPIAPNDTPENRALNRRVEVIIKHQEGV